MLGIEGEVDTAKVDQTVRKETVRIALFSVLLTLLMNAVFLILSRWDITVLWGSLLGLAGGVLDFFLMGLGIQKAVAEEPARAKNIIRLSQQGRLLMLAVLLAVAFALPVFHKAAAVISLLFPKLAVRLLAFLDPGMRGGKAKGDRAAAETETAENGGEGT